MTPELAIEIRKYVSAGSDKEQAMLLAYLMGWFNPETSVFDLGTVRFWQALDEATRVERAAEAADPRRLED